jgi:hypothetical protein
MKKLLSMIAIVLVSRDLAVAQSQKEIFRESMKSSEEASKEGYTQGSLDTSKRYFYKTYSDFVANNPAPGIKYGGKRRMLVGVESVSVRQGESFDYKKIKDLDYWGYIDEWGQPVRIYDNHTYYILTLGKISAYIKGIQATMTTYADGGRDIHFSTGQGGGYEHFISQGPMGDIQEFKVKNFRTMTADDPEIFDKYDEEKIKSNEDNRRVKETIKIAKYSDMYNQKKQ